MIVTINVPVTGTYDLSASMTKAPDYGIVALIVDKSPLGAAFDGYNSSGVTVNPSVDFGSIQLSAGQHQLVFTIAGKNAAAANYLVGIDYLILTKTN